MYEPELKRRHIFPRDRLKEIVDDDATINHIGNLTFIDTAVNEELQDTLPEDYLPAFDEDVLNGHFIPTEKELWKMDNYQRFLETRTELLWKGVEDMMSSLDAT